MPRRPKRVARDVAITNFGMNRRDIEISLQWPIFNFSRYYLDLWDSNISAIFHGNSHAMPTFRLVIYPGGDNENSEEFISLHVYNQRLNGKSFYCYAGIVNSSQKLIMSRAACRTSARPVVYFHKFLNRSTVYEDKKKYLENDTLRIFFQARITHPEPQNLRHIPPCDIDDDFPDGDTFVTEEGNAFRDVAKLKKVAFLRKGMRHLLKSGLHSDCTVFSGKSYFKVHKCMLAESSKVFANRLANLDRKSCKLDLSDIPSDTLQKMLTYIYTGCVRLSRWRTAMEAVDLWKAANHFELPDLKTRCLRHLMNNLKKQDAYEVIKFAWENDLHRLMQLCECLL